MSLTRSASLIAPQHHVTANFVPDLDSLTPVCSHNIPVFIRLRCVSDSHWKSEKYSLLVFLADRKQKFRCSVKIPRNALKDVVRVVVLCTAVNGEAAPRTTYRSGNSSARSSAESVRVSRCWKPRTRTMPESRWSRICAASSVPASRPGAVSRACVSVRVPGVTMSGSTVLGRVLLAITENFNCHRYSRGRKRRRH